MKKRDVLLVILLAAIFVARGPVRAMKSPVDFGAAYAQARTLEGSKDPYNIKAVQQVWDSSGGPPAIRPIPEWNAAVQTPLTFPLLALFGGNWSIALLLWVAVTTLAYVGACYSLSLQTSRPLLFFAIALVFDPAIQGLGCMQPSVLAASLLVVVLFPPQKLVNREVLLGMLLGIAFCMKPLLIGPFFLWPLVRRQWRQLTTASALVLFVGLVSVGRMESLHFPWWREWMANVAFLARPGAPNDPSPLNPRLFHLTNLQVLLDLFVDPTLGNQIALSVVLASLVVWFYVVRKVKVLDTRHLVLLVFITLLPVYHRTYDLMLLLLLVPAGFLFWREGKKHTAAVLWSAPAAVLMPFSTVFYYAQKYGYFSAFQKVGEILIHYQIFFLVAVLAVSLASMMLDLVPRRQRASSAVLRPANTSL